MAQEIVSTKLTAVQGDTWTHDFVYSGAPEIVTFTVRTSTKKEILFQKTLGNGIEEVVGGLRVSFDDNDFNSLPPVLNTLSYALKIREGQVVKTIYQGPLYVFPTH